jgi:hypothetical protein
VGSQEKEMRGRFYGREQAEKSVEGSIGCISRAQGCMERHTRRSDF